MQMRAAMRLATSGYWSWRRRWRQCWSAWVSAETRQPRAAPGVGRRQARHARQEQRVTATGAHVSLIGHITAEELRRKLTATEQANGFANRVYARRSKLLSRGGRIESVDWSPCVEQLRSVLHRKVGSLDLTPAAWEVWDGVYKELSSAPPGLLGAILARGPAQVRRLAVIYALLDSKSIVTEKHLRAALAVWRYAADSAGLLFGNSFGDPTADSILARLREAPDGLRLKGIHDALGRHRTADEIDRALRVLDARGLVRNKREATGGRPTTPGSWAERRLRVGAIASDSPAVSPSRSDSSTNRKAPAWETSPSPSARTSTVWDVVRVFTFRCPPGLESGSSQTAFSSAKRTLPEGSSGVYRWIEASHRPDSTLPRRAKKGGEGYRAGRFG
jgi:hypothetical protein